MDKGYLRYNLGYISTTARVGDVICHLERCDVGVVLRPKQLGYEIIGRALIPFEKGIPTRSDDPNKLHVHFDMVALQQLTA
jgi:hypothetical protein